MTTFNLSPPTYFRIQYFDRFQYTAKPVRFLPLSFSGNFGESREGIQALVDRIKLLNSGAIVEPSTLDNLLSLSRIIDTSQTEEIVRKIYVGNSEKFADVFPGMSGGAILAIPVVLANKDAERIGHALAKSSIETLQQAWSIGCVYPEYLSLALETINKMGELIVNREDQQANAVYQQSIEKICMIIQIRARLTLSSQVD